MALAIMCLVFGIPLLALSTPSVARPTGTVAGIPNRVLSAYQAMDGWCRGLRWQLLAGVGAVESGHGTSGGATVDPQSGEVTPWIFGVPLDGSPGIQRLPIGDWLGWFGLAGPWQQAVGPMQFLAGTFTTWAVDAEGNGVASPHDIDDAVATAANYLCGGREVAMTDERAALRRYNNDGAYVDRVLALADEIGAGFGAGGPIVCPVAGPTTFTNTWLAPRSGGRQHKGVDMFAEEGTPVVAPTSGEIELRDDPLGGLAFHLWGDDGNYYYGAHLSGFARVAGHVAAGTVVGYVGRTGNAVGTQPHLHFEIHPGRSGEDSARPVDPTGAVEAACR